MELDLHNLPKHPPSVDGGNWLTAGQDLLAIEA